jgi:hypothetical protein
MPKHIVSETSSNQETKAKVKIFQELRKITSNTEICWNSWMLNLVVTNLVGSLASATPNLVSSLEIGVEGVQYDSEGHHMIALEVIA